MGAGAGVGDGVGLKKDWRVQWGRRPDVLVPGLVSLCFRPRCDAVIVLKTVSDWLTCCRIIMSWPAMFACEAVCLRACLRVCVLVCISTLYFL